MSYDLKTSRLRVDQPTEMGDLDARVPAGVEACDGDGVITGTSIRAGWSIAFVKVLVRPGHLASIPPQTVIDNGADAELTSATTWRITYPTIPCTDGQCAGDGKNTIGAEVKWERFGDPMDPMSYEEEWEPLPSSASAETTRFFARCKRSEMIEVTESTSRAVTGEPFAFSIGGWKYVSIDVNRGTRLLDADGSPLRARRIACYVRELDWHLNGSPWSAIRTPLGNYKTPTPADRARESNLVVGALHSFQLENLVAADPAMRHPKLVNAIVSSKRRNPTIIDLDDRLDVSIFINALPSGIRPHTGTIVIGVKKLA